MNKLIHGSEIPAALEPVRLTPTTSGYLDAIRGLAAMAVMFGHWRGLFFVDYGHLEATRTSLFVKALYSLSAFGHQAVTVFFVLSGFFISSSILRNVARGAWSWRDYGIDRGVRLYIVLIPGLLMGLLWDSLGLTLFNGSGIYSVPLVPFGSHVPANTLTWASFAGNVLFLQTRFTPVFGSNGPLWSLFNEFWYYALFPALVMAALAARKHAIAKTIGYLLTGAVAIWILGDQVLGFLIWLSGCGVAVASRYVRFSESRWPAALYCLSAGALCCLCLFASHAGGGWLGSDIAVGLSFALLLLGILQLQIPIGQFGLKIAGTFAGFSYSLYVLHFPMLLLIRAKWLPISRWQPDALHLSYGGLIAVFTLIYAFAIAYITERNTPGVRAWLRDKLGLDAVEANRGPQSLVKVGACPS